jgi:hypothetical protein
MKFENAARYGSSAVYAVEFARKHGLGFLVGQSAWVGGFGPDGRFPVLAQVSLRFDHDADRVFAEVSVPRIGGGNDVAAKQYIGPCRYGDAYFAATISLMLASASGADLEMVIFMAESVL